MSGAVQLAVAQTCTTQATLPADARQSIANAAMALGSAVESNATSRVEAMAIAELTSNFAPTAYVVSNTATKIAGDTLRVTQMYQLDASARKPGDTTEADFGCALIGTSDETDFAIPGLPSGVYAFVMVEASGERPWLLAFLLQRQGSEWKMAGFYPHARSAAGHDGLWYWTTARADAKAGKKWIAWVLYGEADQLLRPANFVSSTHLDLLRTERHSNAPNELSDGLSADTPLAIKAKDGSEFHFTDIGSAGTDDGKGLDLVLHFRADPIADPAAGRARNTAAAKALLEAHPELREGFTGVSVFAESANQPPFATVQSLAELQ
ncbi:MAG TPA: hypothetical protein VIJ65_08375 [Acidobacteriaceae bacterium]